MIHLGDIRIFIETARLGSLSAAARSLGRTPAAASAGLKRLETGLGVKLVERNTRNLRLTPEGRRYRESAAAGLDLLDEAGHALHADRGELEGEIRLTAPVDFTRQWLQPLLDAFQAEHPRIRLALVAGDSLRDLVSEPLDLALRYGNLPDSSLVARRLADNRRIVVGAPDYLERHGRPSKPDELGDHTCLLYRRGDRVHRRWTFERAGRTVAIEVDGNRTANDGSLVREWAISGLGLACKSELDVRADIQAGRLEPVLAGWRGEAAPLHLLFPGQGPRPVRVRAFADFLAARLDL